jgi:hypothetical protein
MAMGLSDTVPIVLSGCGAEVLGAKKPLRDCWPLALDGAPVLLMVDLLRFTGLAGDVAVERRFVDPFSGLITAGVGFLPSLGGVPAEGPGVGFFANISLMLLRFENSGMRFPDVGR